MAKLNDQDKHDIAEAYRNGTSAIKLAEMYDVADVTIYAVLDKLNVPRQQPRKSDGARMAHRTNGESKPAVRPSIPVREWFTREECAQITGESAENVEWLVRSRRVPGEATKDGATIMVHLPSLVASLKYAGVDVPTVMTLLERAYTQLNAIATQQALSIIECAFLAAEIKRLLKG